MDASSPSTPTLAHQQAPTSPAGRPLPKPVSSSPDRPSWTANVVLPRGPNDGDRASLLLALGRKHHMTSPGTKLSPLRPAWGEGAEVKFLDKCLSEAVRARLKAENQ